MNPKLKFKEFAAKKPLSITGDGRLLTLTEVAASARLQLGSLHSLPQAAQIKLTLERYALEPDFKLGIIGEGILTRDEIIDHIKNQTPFGQLAVRVEMGYLHDLITALSAKDIPAWPKLTAKLMPKAPDFKQMLKVILLKVHNEVVFCENTTDPVTTPIANRRIATVHPVFQARGFLLVALTGSSDVRANFTTPAKEPLVVYISGVGHGSYTTYTGHWGDHILEVGHYDAAEVKGKALHFLSCETAGQLGPDTITKGAKAYTGYTENFHFVWDNSSTPVDEFALFVDADATFDKMMANGASAQAALNATVQAFNAAIAQVPGTAAASWLTYDRDHLKLCGDPATIIHPYRYVKIGFPLMAIDKQAALVAAGELVDEP